MRATVQHSTISLLVASTKKRKEWQNIQSISGVSFVAGNDDDRLRGRCFASHRNRNDICVCCYRTFAWSDTVHSFSH